MTFSWEVCSSTLKVITSPKYIVLFETYISLICLSGEPISKVFPIDGIICPVIVIEPVNTPDTLPVTSPVTSPIRLPFTLPQSIFPFNKGSLESFFV